VDPSLDILVPINALVLPGLAPFRVVGNPGIIVTPQGSRDSRLMTIHIFSLSDGFYRIYDGPREVNP
jgi:hypothetical protein